MVLVLFSMLQVATASAEPSQGSLTTGTYSNAAGTLKYQLYVPASYSTGTPVPLVVALHGCTQTADTFRKLSKFDDVAAARGFIVVYPEQSKSSNSLGCWNWFQQQHIQRGAGEPSLIAGITQTVAKRRSVDPNRIFVTGLSAGGAMATVMAVTYPDLFAAVGVGSGCEYTAGAACAGYKGTDPEQAGQAAYKAMGKYARAVPFIVFQGDKDTTVPPANADQLVRSWQVTADYADDGQKNASIPKMPVDSVNGNVPNGRSYTVKYYADGHDLALGEYWLVHGMNHAWSGGDASQQYADATGPNESAAMYDFFISHPLGEAAPPASKPGGKPRWPTPSWPTAPGNVTWPMSPGVGYRLPTLK
jgi:poly(hydroxyalkanoate) depolymerase family esterase